MRSLVIHRGFLAASSPAAAGLPVVTVLDWPLRLLSASPVAGTTTFASLIAREAKERASAATPAASLLKDGARRAAAPPEGRRHLTDATLHAPDHSPLVIATRRAVVVDASEIAKVGRLSVRVAVRGTAFRAATTPIAYVPRAIEAEGLCEQSGGPRCTVSRAA